MKKENISQDLLEFKNRWEDSPVYQETLAMLREAPEEMNKGFLRTHELLYQAYEREQDQTQKRNRLCAYIVYTMERLYRNGNLYKTNKRVSYREDSDARDKLPQQVPENTYHALERFLFDERKLEINETESKYDTSDKVGELEKEYRRSVEKAKVGVPTFHHILLKGFHQTVVCVLISSVEGELKGAKPFEAFFLGEPPYEGVLEREWENPEQKKKIEEIEVFFQSYARIIHEEIRERALARQIYDKLDKQSAGKVKKIRRQKLASPVMSVSAGMLFAKEDIIKLAESLERAEREREKNEEIVYGRGTANKSIFEKSAGRENCILIPLATHVTGCTLYLASRNFVKRIEAVKKEGKLDQNHRFVYMYCMISPQRLQVSGLTKKGERKKMSLLSIGAIRNWGSINSADSFPTYSDELMTKKEWERSYGTDFVKVKERYDTFCQRLIDYHYLEDNENYDYSSYLHKEDLPSVFRNCFGVMEEDETWSMSDEDQRLYEEDIESARKLLYPEM